MENGYTRTYANMAPGKYTFVFAFVVTAFFYLITGTLLLGLIFSGIVNISPDGVFMLELYGFVVMLIFGVSYIFIPTMSGKTPSRKMQMIEFTLLNLGIITVFFSSVARYYYDLAPIEFFSFLLIAVSAVMHIMNTIPFVKKTVPLEHRKVPENKDNGKDSS